MTTTATLAETIEAVRTMVADDPLAVMYLDFITGEALDHETADDVAYVASQIAAGVRRRGRCGACVVSARVEYAALHIAGMFTGEVCEFDSLAEARDHAADFPEGTMRVVTRAIADWTEVPS